MNSDLTDLINSSEYAVYPNSINWVNEKLVCMARFLNQDLIISDATTGFSGDQIDISGKQWIRAELNHENAITLREQFPFTSPIRVLKNKSTIGLGDRLGNATAGHVRALKKFDHVLPVLAQQSMRELGLTDRSYSDVLDCASFGVFKEGYKKGFGADGDHLKTLDEVNIALSCGYTMITLDCSDHIRNDIHQMSDEQIGHIYEPDIDLEQRYLGKSFNINDTSELSFSENQLKRFELIYRGVINHSLHIYKSIERKESEVDFELSIDETTEKTSPLQHYFIANELTRQGVELASLAPRFSGEFQKGIDYIGDSEEFRKELVIHAAIAKHFNYKLSVHSGSDKFSVFPIVGEETLGAYHVKTSGTSWLEAIRTIAKKDPNLYREIHQFALTKFPQAQKIYHVTTNVSSIPRLEDISDSQLPQLMSDNDARQLIHITYGFILKEKDNQEKFIYRDRFFRVLNEFQEEYLEILDDHITKHLSYLNQDQRKKES